MNQSLTWMIIQHTWFTIIFFSGTKQKGCKLSDPYGSHTGCSHEVYNSEGTWTIQLWLFAEVKIDLFRSLDITRSLNPYPMVPVKFSEISCSHGFWWQVTCTSPGKAPAFPGWQRNRPLKGCLCAVRCAAALWEAERFLDINGFITKGNLPQHDVISG